MKIKNGLFGLIMLVCGFVSINVFCDNNFKEILVKYNIKKQDVEKCIDNAFDVMVLKKYAFSIDINNCGSIYSVLKQMNFLIDVCPMTPGLLQELINEAITSRESDIDLFQKSFTNPIVSYIIMERIHKAAEEKFFEWKKIKNSFL